MGLGVADQGGDVVVGEEGVGEDLGVWKSCLVCAQLAVAVFELQKAESYVR